MRWGRSRPPLESIRLSTNKADLCDVLSTRLLFYFLSRYSVRSLTTPFRTVYYTMFATKCLNETCHDA